MDLIRRALHAAEPDVRERLLDLPDHGSFDGLEDQTDRPQEWCMSSCISSLPAPAEVFGIVAAAGWKEGHLGSDFGLAMLGGRGLRRS